MDVRKHLIDLSRRVLPDSTRDWIVRQQRLFGLQWPRRGSVRFGSFRRLAPISPVFGLDRGRPIDRYYIEAFLEACACDVRGRCLEMGDDTYIRRFGGDRVARTEILHGFEGNPQATIVADLTRADHIDSNSFDCIICTQTVQMIYDIHAALRHLHRILKPGGVLLLTTHGITKIARRLGRDLWGEYWHLTEQGARALFAETFPGAEIEVRTYGNVMSATASLHGLAAEELTRTELDHCDPDFEVVVAVRARKGPSAS